jgi:hypothetical protein
MSGGFVPHPPIAPLGRPPPPPESMLAIFAVTKGTLCAFMAEHRKHTRLWLPVWSPRLLGTENFADQDETQ